MFQLDIQTVKMSGQEHTNVHTEPEGTLELTESAIPTAPDPFCFVDALCNALDGIPDFADEVPDHLHVVQ